MRWTGPLWPYHVGLAHTSGAFHPKLAVLAGPRRALVAVGSGNLTYGGWQYNHETLTVLHGTTDQVPAAFANVVNCLTDYAADPDIADPLTRNALTHTAQLLAELAERATRVVDTGHRILTSTRGALLDQLPVPYSPVAELSVSAPFHDSHSAALRDLVARFRPARLRVAVQPGVTVVNQDALDAVLTAAAGTGTQVELLTDPANGLDVDGKTGRYRHSKLIEWVDDEHRRWSVTGSPNLTVAAIGRASSQPDGNHEVAVLAPTPVSLFPGGARVHITDVPTVSIRSTAAASHPAALPPPQAAFCAEDRLTVRLPRHLKSDVAVELARRNRPEQWEKVATLFAGQTTVTTAVEPPVRGGDLCRLAGPLPGPTGTGAEPDTAAPAEGEEPALLPGPPAIVTDPATGGSRPPEPKAASRSATVAVTHVLEGDPAALRAWAVELNKLQALVTTSGTRRHRRPADPDLTAALRPGDTTAPRTSSDVADWLWLTETAVDQLGPRLTAFALGLPLPSLAGRGPAHPAAVSVVEADIAFNAVNAYDVGDLRADDLDTSGELDDDTAEQAVADESHSDDGFDGSSADVDSEAALRAALRGATAETRRRQRNDLRRCVEAETGPLAQLSWLKLTLLLWGGGCYPTDLEPLTQVARLLTALLEPAEETNADTTADEPARPAAASSGRPEAGSGPAASDPELRPPLDTVTLASLAAAALTMVHDWVDRRTSTAEHLTYQRLVGAYRPLLPLQDPNRVREYAKGLTAPSGQPLHLDHVEDVTTALTAGDALDAALEILETDGHRVRRLGPGLLKLTGRFPNPARAALYGVATVDRHQPSRRSGDRLGSGQAIGCWAVSESGRWSLVVWRQPDLVTVEPSRRQPGLLWRHQELPEMSSPAALHSAYGGDSRWPYLRNHGPLNVAFAEANELLEDLGLDSRRLEPPNAEPPSAGDC